MLNTCKKRLYLLSVCLFTFVVSVAQQKDSITSLNLSEVEVVEKARPGITREGTPLQVINQAEIEKLGIQDLSEAVRRFSGATVNDYGGIGGLKTVSVRGLGAQHTAVSYDGITITDAQSGQIDISRFTLDNVEELSLSIGQTDNIFQTARLYASAGALLIKTETPHFSNKNYRLKGQIKTGSFGVFNPSLRYEQKLSANYAISANTDWFRADGQYPFTFVNGNITTKEHRKNTDINTLRTELNTFADWGNSGSLQLKGYWFDTDRGLPGSIVLYNDYHKERLRDKNGFLQSSYTNKLSNYFSVKGQAKFNYSWTHYNDFHSKYINGVQTDVYTQREYYLSGALLYAPTKELSFSFAEDYALNTLDATTPKCPFPTRNTSLSVVGAQYKNNRLTITGSLLGTYIAEKVESSYAAAPDRKRLSPAASLSYRLLESENLRFRLSYKDIFRTPTFSDLYFNRIGNIYLESEKATQYNVGLTWSGAIPGIKLDYLSITTDGYYNKVKDKIVALPTMFIWKMMNRGEVEIKGVDANVSAHFTLSAKYAIQLDGSYSFQQAIDVTDKESKTYRHQLPYTPKHAGSASVTIENPWVNISWLLSTVSSRYLLPQNIKMNLIDGYTEQQLSLSRAFVFRNYSLRIHAEIINLGDVSYDVIRYYPMPGRSFRAGIQFSY